MRSRRRLQCRAVHRSLALAAAIIAAAGAAAVASAESSLRLEADPSSPGSGNQQVTEPLFALSVLNMDAGGGDTTAYRVQLLVSVPDPDLLASVIIDLDGVTSTIAAGDLEMGTPHYPCSGRPVPPHGVYPAYWTSVDLGDILAQERVDMTVTVAGDDDLSVHFEAIGEALRQQGNSTVCRDVFAPSGHHVTARLGGGSIPTGECAADLDKTSDVDAVLLGEQAEFTLTAVAGDGCDLTSVVLTDSIPIVVDDSGAELPAFTVVGIDPTPASVGDTEIVWDLGDLVMGAVTTATITVVFDQPLAQGHEIVNAACLTAAELDGPECDAAVIAVGDVIRPEPLGGPGFWCRQTRAALDGRHNARFTLDELAAWLADTNNGSMVFTELYDTSSVELARPLLCRPNALLTAADRLARHHLTLWLNLAAERVDPDLALGRLCPGSEQPPEGTDPAWSVGFVRDQSEAAMLDGEDDATLAFWLDVIDFVNNASVTETCGPTLRRPRGSRRPQP